MKIKIIYCLAFTGILAMISCQKSKCKPHHDCPNHSGTTTTNGSTVSSN
ncbi:MAG: hypothetical protein ACXVNM_01685 [Bacteroidia bacterium]